MPKKSGRFVHIVFRISEEERAMAKDISDAKGITVSDLLRQYIRSTYTKHLRQMNGVK